LRMDPRTGAAEHHLDPRNARRRPGGEALDGALSEDGSMSAREFIPV
jgi:hypothetical protein